jgi:hypothetical protein
VVLTPSGSLTVKTAGAVIEGLDISGTVEINANNVTIRNSRIRAASGAASNTILIRTNSYTGTVVQDVELDCASRAQAGIYWTGYTLTRVDIHHCIGDGADIGGSNVTIQDSWIHDLIEVPGSHNDGIQITSGSNIRLLRNHVTNGNTQTSALKVGADQGDISNVTIDGNWIGGGGYALYLGCGTSPTWCTQKGWPYTVGSATVRNNRWLRSPKSPGGPVLRGEVTVMPVWSGNVWDDTGAAVGF